MNIDLNSISNTPGLSGQSRETGKEDLNREKAAFEFERIFARQVTEQMMRGLFENSDSEGVFTSGNHIYREHIVNTLAEELAAGEPFGFSDMVREYWNKFSEDSNPTTSTHGNEE